MRSNLILLSACILTVTACSGGGGDSGEPTPSTTRDLGSRAVPGYDVRIRQAGPAVPGQSLDVAMTITLAAGSTLPTTVEAALSASEPTAWTVAPQAGDGAWHWTWSAPGTLTDQRVWVRLTDADGNLAQSGPTDFALQP